MDKNINNIIFDLDGTLIDSAPSILECFKRVLESNNIEPLLPLNSNLIGPPLVQTLSRLTGIQESTSLSKLTEDFKKQYDFGGYKSTVPFPGVSELLRECISSGYSLHIATNKRLMPTDLILEYLGWNQHFKSIYALDLISPPFANKARMLSALLVDEKILHNSAIYVGDRAEDHESAIANGLEFIGASWGYRDEALLSNNAITCCQNVEQFFQHLDT
jgi:phosphoglycolate phosphatase